MIRGIFASEESIKRWEDLAPQLPKGRRRIQVPGEPGPRYVDGRQELAEARRRRDAHLIELHHLIDYALNTEAYEDVTCPDCRPWHMSLEPLVFIREAAIAEPPPGSTAMCETCKGRGLVRRLKTDSESQAAFKRITYFKSVVETTVLCAKVRAGTSDANEAYLELEKQNYRLLNKFGNEAQTSLEGEDALQGVRQGIVDAARRFDPTREECANFGTVAYNWAYRNSRHRHPGQKRAGVYARSIDGMAADDADFLPTDRITSTSGPFGTCDLENDEGSTLVIDMRDQISNLPEDQRAVVMALMGGDNVATAARSLGMKRAAVKRLRDTAFASLRRTLSDYVEVVCD